MDQLDENRPPADWTGQLRGLPCADKSVMKALQQLSSVRELTLRPRRLALNLEPKKNQEAALGQICGELALAACLRCANGKGPFVQCVVVKDRFAKSCCNCHYSSQGLSCSFRRTGGLFLRTSFAITDQCLQSRSRSHQPHIG